MSAAANDSKNTNEKLISTIVSKLKIFFIPSNKRLTQRQEKQLYYMCESFLFSM